MQYPKNPSSIEEQIKLLQSRGLIIHDSNKAKSHLSAISYFRLSGYMRSLQKPSDPNHIFIEGTTLDNIINIYEFDRNLRILVFDAIERIEIAVRTQIMHVMSLKFDKNWYEKADLFDAKMNHPKWIKEIHELCNNSKEMFIRYYLNTFADPQFPPSWMVIEILSFGHVSTLYKYINATEQKIKIASYFKTHDNILGSWLHCLSNLRNHCAHHSRIWDRNFPFRPIMPSRKKFKFLEKTDDIDTRKLYTLLCCIQYLLNAIYHDASFKQKLKALLQSYSEVPVAAMGFTAKWNKEPFWANHPANG